MAVKLRRLLARPAGAVAYVAVRAVAPLWMRIGRVDELLRLVDVARPLATEGLEDWLDSAERWTDRAWLLPRTCLYRAVARYAIASAAGRSVEFVLGVRRVRAGAAVEAHAWIEHDGVPRADCNDFREILRHPPRLETTA